MNKKGPTTTRKRKSKELVLKKVMQNQLLRRTKIKESEMKNIPDEEMPDKKAKLESYVNYCEDLRESYIIKHEEVIWYTRIIADIKENVLKIISANTSISGENRNYLLGVIEYIMTLDIDPGKKKELEEMKEQQVKWVDKTKTNLLDLQKDLLELAGGEDFDIDLINSFDSARITQKGGVKEENAKVQGKLGNGVKVVTNAAKKFRKSIAALGRTRKKGYKKLKEGSVPAREEFSAPGLGYLRPIPTAVSGNEITAPGLGENNEETAESLNKGAGKDIGEKLEKYIDLCEKTNVLYLHKHNEVEDLFNMIQNLILLLEKLIVKIKEEHKADDGKYKMLIAYLKGSKIIDQNLDNLIDELDERLKEQQQFMEQAEKNYKETTDYINTYISKPSVTPVEENNSKPPLPGPTAFTRPAATLRRPSDFTTAATKRLNTTLRRPSDITTAAATKRLNSTLRRPSDITTAAAKTERLNPTLQRPAAATERAAQNSNNTIKGNLDNFPSLGENVNSMESNTGNLTTSDNSSNNSLGAGNPANFPQVEKSRRLSDVQRRARQTMVNYARDVVANNNPEFEDYLGGEGGEIDVETAEAQKRALNEKEIFNRVLRRNGDVEELNELARENQDINASATPSTEAKVPPGTTLNNSGNYLEIEPTKTKRLKRPETVRATRRRSGPTKSSLKPNPNRSKKPIPPKETQKSKPTTESERREKQKSRRVRKTTKRFTFGNNNILVGGGPTKRGILQHCCRKGDKEGPFLGTIISDKGKRLTFRTHNKKGKVKSLKKLKGKEITYQETNDKDKAGNPIAMNIQEYVPKVYKNEYPALNAKPVPKSKKKKGPSEYQMSNKKKYTKRAVGATVVGHSGN